jgi:hypothetical protein
MEQGYYVAKNDEDKTEIDELVVTTTALNWFGLSANLALWRIAFLEKMTFCFL